MSDPRSPTPSSSRKGSSGAHAALDRRRFLACLSGAGLGGGLFPGALWAAVQEAGEITPEAVERAAEVAGLSMTGSEREMLLSDLRDHRESYASIRSREIPPDIPPALRFDPDPTGSRIPAGGRSRRTRPAGLQRPDSDVDLAFLPVTHLSELVRQGEVTSLELTELYLERLRRHGPTLECVVTLTEERAREQAARADDEIARGVDRGPLHGIPWGAKDLLSVRGYPTTWGAAPFREQAFDHDAAVVERLDEAGAVLVAKLTLGALAMGDVWYGGRTRSPWNLERGSSGSSAGSAAATAAGLVAFAVGSETLGSIVSPSTRCGVTGLRPTFGRVSRYGAMPLSWSMDKLGPIGRTVEDCALVLEAVHGADGRDVSARSLPFAWDAERPMRELRVGYYRDGFESPEASVSDLRGLAVLREMGTDPVSITLPREVPTDALGIILDAEAGAAFDALTRSGRDEELVRQDEGAWPNILRASRFIPAVEYIQANRLRTRLMGALESALSDVDVLVTPSYADPVLLMTNLTGHPAVVVPNGFESGDPVGLTFVGRVWGEAAMLAAARAYQAETGFHLVRPPLFG